jgi:hypothetical protein
VLMENTADLFLVPAPIAATLLAAALRMPGAVGPRRSRTAMPEKTIRGVELEQQMQVFSLAA